MIKTHTILFLTLLPALTGHPLSLIIFVEEQWVCNQITVKAVAQTSLRLCQKPDEDRPPPVLCLVWIILMKYFPVWFTWFDGKDVTGAVTSVGAIQGRGRGGGGGQGYSVGLHGARGAGPGGWGSSAILWSIMGVRRWIGRQTRMTDNANCSLRRQCLWLLKHKYMNFQHCHNFTMEWVVNLYSKHPATSWEGVNTVVRVFNKLLCKGKKDLISTCCR